ncbi:MAG: membrane protein insertion efficiency factor YidD [Campylobacterales bacterium]
MYCMIRRLLLGFLKFYQRYLTVVSYGSCRYYPTCSEYARWQIAQGTMPQALWDTLLRVLRCNPLFAGGIDYPNVNCPRPRPLSNAARHGAIVWWYIPTSDGRCYLIKALG